jgi:hypothetical protein
VTVVVPGAWVLAMTPEQAPIRDGAIAVGEDGAITAVGRFEELRRRFPDPAEVIGDGNGIVLPGSSTPTPISPRACSPGWPRPLPCGSGSSGSSIRQGWP